MKIIIPFAVVVLGLLGAGCESKSPVPGNPSPFQAMVFRGGSMIGTLPTTPPNWIVAEGSAPPRVTKPGESFVMPAGSTLLFSDKHQSYRLTAQLKPDQGLIIESRFDGRSFGDEIVERKYFISVK